MEKVTGFFPAPSNDSEYVKKCREILSDYTNGTLTKSQFLEACDYLDEVASQIETQRKDMWDKIHLEGKYKIKPYPG